MNQIIRYGLAWLGYVIAQILLFDYMVAFQVAIPFVFLVFFLTLPFDTGKGMLYILAFATGLVIDLLSSQGTVGLHSLSLLVLVGMREPVVNLISTTNVRSIKEISLQGQNGIWIATYFLPLILGYQLTYFLFEALTFSHFGITLLKVVGSTFYTFILAILITYVFYKR